MIKANLRSCQRQCSHCLIETIPYLLFSNKGIREQAKLVSFSTYLAPHEPRAHTVASLRGKDRVFVLHQNEKGRNEKAKSQITEGLIPFLKAVSSGGKQRGGGGENTFRPFAMAAYFFVLIPPRLLTSKAPALWHSRTERDWEIWRSIFSRSILFPRRNSMWFFSPFPRLFLHHHLLLLL